MTRKMRRGPFKGRRLEEVDILELLAYLRTDEAEWDKNVDLTLAVLEDLDRRRTTPAKPALSSSK